MESPVLSAQRPPDTPYQAELNKLTLYSALTGTGVELFYAVYYGISHFTEAFLFSLISVIPMLIGLGLIARTSHQRLAAQFIIFSTYFLVVTTSVFTGGIEASSLPWMAFIPVAAALLRGGKSGISWAVIVVVGIIVIYMLPSWGWHFPTEHLSQTLDRTIDNALLVIVVAFAVISSELIKEKAFLGLQQAEKRMTQLASIDPLTQAYNRRYFFNHAEQVLSHPTQPTSLLLLDIDHFKKINDTHGHRIGDDTLSKFVSICQENLRKNDLLARLGGEEFVILLSDTRLSGAQHIASRLLDTIRRTSIATENGPISFTVSIGITITENNTLSIDTLVEQADRAMYQAKQNGRDCFAVYSASR